MKAEAEKVTEVPIVYYRNTTRGTLSIHFLLFKYCRLRYFLVFQIKIFSCVSDKDISLRFRRFDASADLCSELRYW